MGETITIRTPSSTEVIKVIEQGPQGPVGPKGDPGDVAGLPLTTTGDTLYRANSTTNARLPIGATGQVLKVVAGLPAWAEDSGGVSSWNDLTDKPATFAPSAHTHTASAITDFTTASAAAAPVQSVAGRTGAVTLAVADVSGAVASTDSRLSDSRPPTSHTHGNLTNSGAIGTTANLPLITGTNGVVEAGAFGTAAGSFCEGNDVRLSDSRSPASHAASHAAGGTDVVTPNAIGAQSVFDSASATFSSDQALSAQRARIQTVSNTNASGINITLPTSTEGSLTDDIYVIRGGGTISGPITIRHVVVPSVPIYQTLATINSTGQQYRFRSDGASSANWSVVSVDTHTHVVADVTGAAASGSITTSGLTQSTARILGRTTASTGAVEEIQIGAGLSLSAGELSATGGGGSSIMQSIAVGFVFN